MSDEQIPAGSQPPVEVMETVEEPVVEVAQDEPEESPKMYAGKYKSPEDLESAYGELASKLGEQGSTVGELKTQNKVLMDQLQNMHQSKSQEVEQAREEAPPTDYEKMLRDISKKADDGDISMEEALFQTAEITRERTEAVVESRAESVLDEAVKKFEQTLSERDTQAVVDKFNVDNPDFAEFQSSGAKNQMLTDNPLHDDLSAFYAWKASQAEAKAAEAFEKGKAEAARIKAGSEPATKVLSKPGQSIQAQNKVNKPMTPAERRASAFRAAGLEP